MTDHFVEETDALAEHVGRSLQRARRRTRRRTGARRVFAYVSRALAARSHAPAPRATQARTIGELAVAGDRACGLGEVATLEALARELATRVDEPLHCELVGLAESCRGDPAGAIHWWPLLRERVFR